MNNLETNKIIHSHFCEKKQIKNNQQNLFSLLMIFSHKVFWYFWYFLKSFILPFFWIFVIYFLYLGVCSSFSLNNELSSQFVESDENEHNKDWANSIPNEETRNKINSILNFSESLSKYRKGNKSVYNKGNMIFYGSPGTGKSYSAALVAQNFSSYYAIVPAGSLQQIYIGSGSKKWLKIIEEARKKSKLVLKKGSKKPVIIIVEEIDSLAKKGKDRSFSPVDDTLINTFLESIDSISRNNDNILVIGTTNYLSLIEDAAKRAGRFQTIEFNGLQDRKSYSFLIDNVKKKISFQYFVTSDEKELSVMIEKNQSFIFIDESFWTDLENKIFCLVDELNVFFNFAEIYESVEKNIFAKREKLESDDVIFLESFDVDYSINYVKKEFSNNIIRRR